MDNDDGFILYGEPVEEVPVMGEVGRMPVLEVDPFRIGRIRNDYIRYGIA